MGGRSGKIKTKHAIIILTPITATLIAVILSFTPFSFINSPTTEYKQENPKYAKILFAGDLMFDRGIRYYANLNGGNNFIFAKISDLLAQNDLAVVNLEGPITNNKSVSAGTAPGSTNNYYFTFDPSVARTLYDKNIKIVNLGNNHILNFGRDGLKQTKEYLDKAGVGYFGSPDYPRSVSTEIKNIKITLISYNEFSGLQDLEAPTALEEIKKAEKYSDIIIVYCHWGAEYAPNPAEGQINLARQFIDAGADLIIGSHPHVIGLIETYKNKKIYYSLGNFIFDQYFDESVRNGLAVSVKIDAKTKSLDFTEHKIYLDITGQTVLK